MLKTRAITENRWDVCVLYSVVFLVSIASAGFAQGGPCDIVDISPRPLEFVSVNDAVYRYPSTIWLGRNDGSVYRSTDDGSTWERFETVSKDPITALYFNDKGIGCAGAPQKMQYTSDYGKSWELVDTPNNAIYRGFASYGESGAIVCGSNGCLMASEDLKSWRSMWVQDTAIMLKRIARMGGIIVTSGFDERRKEPVIFVSQDTGTSWKRHKVPNLAVGIAIISEDTLLYSDVFGLNKYIFSENRRTVVYEDMVRHMLVIKRQPNATSYVITGDHGFYWIYDNSTNILTRCRLPVIDESFGLDVADNGLYIIGTSDGYVYRHNAGTTGFEEIHPRHNEKNIEYYQSEGKLVIESRTPIVSATVYTLLGVPIFHQQYSRGSCSITLSLTTTKPDFIFIEFEDGVSTTICIP